MLKEICDRIGNIVCFIASTLQIGLRGTLLVANLLQKYIVFGNQLVKLDLTGFKQLLFFCECFLLRFELSTLCGSFFHVVGDLIDQLFVMVRDTCDKFGANGEVVQTLCVEEDLQCTDLSGSIQCSKSLLQKLHGIFDLLGRLLKAEFQSFNIRV